jgi:hypothetical protein
MNFVTLLASFEKSSMPLKNHYTTVLAVPMNVSGSLQVIYVLDLLNKERTRISLDMEKYTQDFYRATEMLKKEMGIGSNLYPFGLSEEMFKEFCITPHSFLYMGDNRLLCGLDMFNRYEIINLQDNTIHLLDPGVDDDWLTAAPSFDADNNLIFGSTNLRETIIGILDSDRPSFTRFWKLDKDNKLTELWQGRSGALLHQIKVAGVDNKAEEGNRHQPRIIYINKDGSAADGAISGGAYVNFTNLKNGDVYKVGPFDVPAHVESHPLNPNIVYLSEHNFRMESGIPVILGNAAVFRFEMGENGPVFTGRYTHPELYRMTSHELFQLKDDVLIALTGYPDTVFIVDANSLKLVKKIKFKDGEKVDISNGPFRCNESTYGCQISANGDILFIVDSTMLRVIEIETGNLLDQVMYTINGDPSFVGHSFSFER